MLTLTLKCWYLLYTQFFILFFKVWPVYSVRVTHKSVLVWQTIALILTTPQKHESKWTIFVRCTINY